MEIFVSVYYYENTNLDNISFIFVRTKAHTTDEVEYGEERNFHSRQNFTFLLQDSGVHVPAPCHPLPSIVFLVFVVCVSMSHRLLLF